MSAIRLAGAYAVVATVLATIFAFALLAGPYRAVERSDYMTYHVAGRIVLAGDGDCLYLSRCQAEVQRELIGDEPSFQGGALPFTSPPWLAVVVAPLSALPLRAGFFIFTAFGAAVLALAAWRLTPSVGAARLLGPLLLLTAWPTVMGMVRGQLSLLVVGLLGISVALARYRSGAALGLAGLKPTLVPLWGLWQLAGGHWRAVGIAVATLLGMIILTVALVGTRAVAEYPAYLLDVAGENAVGVHPGEMVTWRGAAERLGTGPWLLVAGSALTLIVVALIWYRTANRELGAAAAFLATPLVVPHANQHEFVLGSLGILLLIVVAGRARRLLAMAAVGTHAALWVGPVLEPEASAWLMFAALLAWLAVAAVLAWTAAAVRRRA